MFYLLGKWQESCNGHRKIKQTIHLTLEKRVVTPFFMLSNGRGKPVPHMISFWFWVKAIHRMQIWRTTRSAPGTSCIKARLVRLLVFVLTILPQKSLASSSMHMWSVLFRCPYELLCFWMTREGIKIFHRSPLRENSGSMQFVETSKSSSRSPRKLKFVCYMSG